MPVRRLLIIPLAIAALSSGQALAADPTDDPVELGVEVSSCETGATGDDRVVVFRGSMPSDSRALRLGMNFELQSRAAGDEDFARVTAPNFGVWQKSAAHASGYVADKRVEGLAPGSAYRVVVRYRWYAKGGKVVRSTKRTSAQCKQPDARRAPSTTKRS